MQFGRGSFQTIALLALWSAAVRRLFSLLGLCVEGGVKPPHSKALRASFAGGLLLAMSLSSLSCSSKGEADAGPVVTVQVASAERRKVERKITAQAVLFPLQQDAIAPKISAPVRKFYVDRGQHVHAGDLLAELENRDLAASATENEGTYSQAQAAYETTVQAAVPEEVQKAELDVKAAKETMDAAQKVFENRKMLFEQGAAPRKDLEDATVALTQANNQYTIAKKHLEALQSFGKEQELKAARGQLTAAKARYENAQAQLSYSQIRSQIDGVVTDRPLYAGEMAAAGTAIITVMDISEVVAKLHLPQQEAQSLRVGNAATLTVPGLEGDTAGQVTVVSPALDPNSTTVEVWVQAANRHEQLKPGTSAQVTIVTQTVSDAIVVPAAALLTASDGGTSVIVASGDKPEQRPVKTGIRDGDDVQITGGLKPGEQVVTAGAYEISQEDPDVLKKTKLQIATPPKEEGSDKGSEPGQEKD
jgi:multidrug efflux pump subunit AcrA (membrane-fusion protein)